jgi:hypothetical protein
VAVRPYRYAHVQKGELEHQCVDMLAHDVIRPSTSAFSTLVILNKKSDSSWWLCVDYHALNTLTVKDKFPIPVVEELLDELRGAKFFANWTSVQAITKFRCTWTILRRRRSGLIKASLSSWSCLSS